MATDENQKYQKVIQWLLNNVNPELLEIQTTAAKIMKSLDLPCSQMPYTQSPSDLVQVLEQVELAEEHIGKLTHAFVPSFQPRQMPTVKPNEVVSTADKFEKLFARLLPRIDASLSSIEESIFIINTHVTKIELEPIPTPPPNQTAMQRQVRFVDKAKRIRNNFSMIEDSLPSNVGDAPVETVIECLYEAPAWSTSPKGNFYFEIRDSETLIDKIPINVSGHYLIGRLPLCDIVVDDATCSRQHAVIQFRPGDPDPVTGARADEVYIYDLGSTSGTFVNMMPLQPKAYYPLYKGDVLQFGQYSSCFVLRDGTEPGLTPPQLEKEKEAADAPPPQADPTATTISTRAANIINDEEPTGEPSSDHAEENQPKSPESDDTHNDIISVPEEVKQEVPEDTEHHSMDPSDTRSDNDTFSIEEVFDSRAEDCQKLKPLDDDPLSRMNSEVIVVKLKKNTVEEVDPHSASFDQDEYKRKMIEAYEKQMRENEEILRKRKEREAQGLPPIIEIPYVPDRPQRRATVANVVEATSQRKDKKRRFGLFKRK